ncbi:hypothetical protein CRG98_004330 [Punica granatum]|uniref:Uncharacterized protein n=1 Tax=Punica granatum TaxID=22663 RepID=A0A2I0L3T4_PUNGR|nr:hypothetical protein CRG98_004330 [Punica granatum]
MWIERSPSPSRRARRRQAVGFLIEAAQIHNSRPLMLKSLKSLADHVIRDQHFTRRDFSEAVLNFEIGNANNVFMCLEELYFQFREVAKVGEHLNFEACLDVMDLLYEEDTSILHCSPCSLAAAVLDCF